MTVKRGNLTRFSLLIIGFLTLILSIVYSAVEPSGPDTITVTNSSRGPAGDVSSPVTVQAQAGNTTQLVIFDERSTQAWQGYFGNITGTVSLEDSSGKTFYDWAVANPRGEVYASNFTSVDWGQVHCLNVSQTNIDSVDDVVPSVRPDGSVSGINSTLVELSYGINRTDIDGLNETYDGFYSSNTGFFVGALHFNGTDGCSLGNPYVNSAASAAWDNVILSDNDTIIFTAIIREDASDFRNMASDFQLLVLENGHVGLDTTTTPYYFYVEIS
ncbi:MAG TPA: hypothetical protein VJB12_03970 [Candidatus Nanoarchaeia archaeon]|nr:hypothetical protein [Candidatus Nanoarchaeia archaeon]